VIELNSILTEVLINLAESYPQAQAQASGGTPRMRKAITDVNRTEDEDNDLSSRVRSRSKIISRMKNAGKTGTILSS
jgi:hypothetical protein